MRQDFLAEGDTEVADIDIPGSSHEANLSLWFAAK
jgi:hypothetical protein